MEQQTKNITIPSEHLASVRSKGNTTVLSDGVVSIPLLKDYKDFVYSLRPPTGVTTIGYYTLRKEKLEWIDCPSLNYQEAQKRELELIRKLTNKASEILDPCPFNTIKEQKAIDKKRNKEIKLLTEPIEKSKSTKSQLLQLPITNNKLTTQTTNQPNLLTINQSNSNLTLSSLIYVGNGVYCDNPTANVVSEDIGDPVSASFPLYYKNSDLIKIPNKVERSIRKYTPRGLLHEIHPDDETAIELCLMFLANLSATYFIMKDNPEDEILGAGWKSLDSQILKKQFQFKNNTYTKIVIALCHVLVKGPILECDKKYKVGKKCYYYRLGDAYRAKGVTSYEVRSDVAKKLLKANRIGLIARSYENVITKNLTSLYPHIELPTIEEILIEAKLLVEAGYMTKKRKKLTFLNKHSKEYFSDADERSFVEDAMEVYCNLTSNGTMVPKVGSKRSGGRIVDSFTLMPSWIRKMVKINGQRIVEVDYTALHPNICATIYGGTKKHITHDFIAQEAGISKDLVKQEHLSFYNKKWKSMQESPLFDYYMKTDLAMMRKIYNDKKESPYKHKITSRKLFKKEVEIMTDVVSKLNSMGIYVGYVYDALFCKPVDIEMVKQVMDEVVLQHSVYTTAKYDGAISKQQFASIQEDKLLSEAKSKIDEAKTETTQSTTISNTMLKAVASKISEESYEEKKKREKEAKALKTEMFWKRKNARFKLQSDQLKLDLSEVIEHKVDLIGETYTDKVNPDYLPLEEAKPIQDSFFQFDSINCVNATIINSQEVVNDMLQYVEYISEEEMVCNEYPPNSFNETELKVYREFREKVDEEFTALLELNVERMEESA